MPIFRMVVGSFLVKDLLVDWRIGEKHFRHLLVDYDASQNVGNWQWVAGTGTDAAPYHRVSKEKSRVAVVEKYYEKNEKPEPPRLLVSNEDAVSSHALDGDSDLQVKCLLPDEPQFDFAVNTMVYQPGAALSMVEMHVMEHGLIMLEGGGVYRLGDSWYPVRAGDFIWMAPYCPQWFGALGKTPAKYLIYKDWNRHPVK